MRHRVKIGLGGGGCNAITRMVREDIQGVEFVGMNTDAQALAITEAPIRVQIGEKISRGLGVGGDHVLGRNQLKKAEMNSRNWSQGRIWCLSPAAWVVALAPVRLQSSLK